MLASLRFERGPRMSVISKERNPVDAVPNVDNVLEARDLIKTFGNVVGLDGVDLELRRGEILAVIGDNGAGKSTLIKCLTGALVPDAGELTLEEAPITFRGPQDARAAGIETV